SGAHHFGRERARNLMRKDEQYVLLLDTNARNIALAQKEGLPAMHCDGMEAEKLYENEQALFGAGYVLALTDNIELNELLMQRWGEELANEKVFGWIPTDAPSSDDRLVGQSIRRGKQLRAIPQDSSLKEMVKDEDEVICLRRSEGFLLRALQSGGFLRLECETLDALYEQLARVAVEQVEALSEEKILEDLGAQGRIFPAFIGHGIAIPHVYCEDLDYRICFVAQLTNPLEIPGQDEAIDFVFFLLSPTGDSEGHLATLADIAKTSRSDRLRKQIKHAKSVDDVITAISG
ncbi:MAG: PTS sugar transporter subunit IIA, partial [Opitutales bacterium]|nr:PTS sugar transporter subunit IIA [Opitutales bacterium]